MQGPIDARIRARFAPNVSISDTTASTTPQGTCVPPGPSKYATRRPLCSRKRAGKWARIDSTGAAAFSIRGGGGVIWGNTWNGVYNGVVLILEDPPPAQPLTVAVVGATGLVGQTMIQVLTEREFPLGELRPLASGRSAGRELTINGSRARVQEAVPDPFEGVDGALVLPGHGEPWTEGAAAAMERVRDAPLT